jgi:hypothetical protein
MVRTMRVAGWVETGLGVAAGLAALMLWRSHLDDVRNSEEARVARSAANVALEPLGKHIPAPAAQQLPSAAVPPQAPPPPVTAPRP